MEPRERKEKGREGEIKEEGRERERERDLETERKREREGGRERERILWKRRLNITCGEHLCCGRCWLRAGYPELGETHFLSLQTSQSSDKAQPTR